MAQADDFTNALQQTLHLTHHRTCVTRVTPGCCVVYLIVSPQVESAVCAAKPVWKVQSA